MAVVDAVLNLLQVLGLAAVVAGVWLIYMPAGLIVGGVVATAVAAAYEAELF